MTLKHFLPALAGLATAGIAFGQTTRTTTATTTAATTGASPAVASSPAARRTRTTTAERIVMANGGLAEIKGTRATRVDLETVLPNGVHVTPGGTVNYPDGTTTNMRDGQMITMDGKISAASPDFVAEANKALDAGSTGEGQRATDRAAAERAAAAAAAAAAAEQSNQDENNSSGAAGSSSSPMPGAVSSGSGAVEGNKVMGSGIGTRTIATDRAATPNAAGSPTEQNANALKSGRGRASTTNAGNISAP